MAGAQDGIGKVRGDVEVTFFAKRHPADAFSKARERPGLTDAQWLRCLPSHGVVDDAAIGGRPHDIVDEDSLAVARTRSSTQRGSANAQTRR